MLNTSPSPAGRGVLAVVALAAAALLLQRCHGWSDEDHLLLPPIVNSSAAAAAANTFLHHRAAADLDLQDLEPVDVDVRYSKRSVVQDQDDSEASAASAASGVSDGGGSALLQCNVSVQRLLPTSLVARWDASLGFQCDVLVYTTTTNSHSGGRAFFSASFNRALSPVLVEHLGGVTGGQQELRLCVGGCGLSRYSRRFGRGGSRRQGGGDAPPPVNFCCVDFSLDELQGDKSWRLNRKPVESTLVACFMTLVIIVWSVAALIWPVPIIAGFLPNGMEQRRPR